MSLTPLLAARGCLRGPLKLAVPAAFVCASSWRSVVAKW